MGRAKLIYIIYNRASNLSSIADGASEGVFGAHTGAANALAALKGVGN
jgi:hypothetical protein